MSATLLTPELERAAAHLAPYARSLLDQAARHALELHAEELAVEHLVLALLEDEESAAHRALLSFFADPETIQVEVLALSPGVLVVGSGRSLPFSERGAGVLRGARVVASARGATLVEPMHLFAAALDVLEEGAREGLLGAGLSEAGLGRVLGAARDDAAPPEAAGERGLLASFGEDAIALCGVACRVARQLRRDAISPAHLLCAALERHPELGEATGLSLLRARAALTGLDEDSARPAERLLEASVELEAVLTGAPPGADSLVLLARIAELGSAELRLLLGQHRVEPQTLGDARGRLSDPGGGDADSGGTTRRGGAPGL